MKKFLVIVLRKNIDIILVGIFWGHTEEMQSMNKRFLVNFYCRAFLFEREVRFLYKGIIIKHNKTEPTYTKTSLFLCEKRRFFMARTEKGVVTTI